MVHAHARTHALTRTHTHTHGRTHTHTHTAFPKTHLFDNTPELYYRRPCSPITPQKPTPTIPTRNRLQTTWHKHLHLEREVRTTAPRAGQCQARQQYTHSHARGPSVSLSIGSGCLDVANAELSPKRYWRGPRSQEVGLEGNYT